MAATADARYGKWTRRSDLNEDRVARIRGKMEADVAAYRLREIREDQRRTQVDVAQQLGVTQKRVSEIESADILHTEYGTLARYVDALGGRLKLVRTSATTPSPSAEWITETRLRPTRR